MTPSPFRRAVSALLQGKAALAASLLAESAPLTPSQSRILHRLKLRLP